MREYARDQRVVALGALLLAASGWLVLWDTTSPRTGWDGLMYHRFALEYVGAPVEEQESVAWYLFERYGDPALVEPVSAGIEAGNSPWEAISQPSRERWVDIYRSRPMYPLLVGAAYPLFGSVAPLLVSALAVLIFTAAMVVGIGRLHGYGVALVSVLLTFSNPRLSQWLISLVPDGLGIALWTASLVLTALYVRGGSRRWLLAFAATAALLAFTRPIGAFLAPTLLLAAGAAGLARRPEWRRLALASATSILLVGIFALYSILMELPGLRDQLQDLPTRHFNRPDVADPLAWTVEVARLQLSDPLLPTFAGDPSLWGPMVIAVIGFVVIGRSWSLSPFVAAILVLPLAYLAHPQLSEAPRIMAPIWASLSLGMALVVVWVIGQLQALPISPDPRSSTAPRGAR